MARNNPKPSEKVDWINTDDPAKIIAPTAAQKLAGWVKDQLPPAERFNWFWNLLSRFTDYFGGQVEDWIVIDSDAVEGDYSTLAAYIADAPAAGDRVLVKENQTLTAQMIVPNGITLKFLDGASILCATNIASSILQLGNDIVIEGVLNLTLSQTGTTAKAVEYNGDNVVGKINVYNTSTGTLTTAHHINANKTGNRVEGFIANTGGGVLTAGLVDNSTEDSNILTIIDNTTNEPLRSYGAKSFRDGLEFDLGSDADGDIYYRTGGILTRLPNGTEGQHLTVQFGLPSWTDLIFSGFLLSEAIYLEKSPSISAQDTNTTGLFFKPDGSSVFIVGQNTDAVYQYNLSTPWNVSTAVYSSKSFSVAAQDTAPTGIFFTSDGLSMYMIGDINNTVYQYTLSTAWDISTASYASKSFSVNAQATNPQDVFFKSDGLVMMVLGGVADGNKVFQYTLSTPWDVSTAVYASKFFSVNTQETDATGVYFKADGSIMFAIGNANNTVYQYTLSTPWDISTASYASKSFNITTEEPTPQAVFFKGNGGLMFVVGISSDRIFQYSTSRVSA